MASSGFTLCFLATFNTTSLVIWEFGSLAIALSNPEGTHISGLTSVASFTVILLRTLFPNLLSDIPSSDIVKYFELFLDHLLALLESSERMLSNSSWVIVPSAIASNTLFLTLANLPAVLAGWASVYLLLRVTLASLTTDSLIPNSLANIEYTSSVFAPEISIPSVSFAAKSSGWSYTYLSNKSSTSFMSFLFFL